MNELRRWFDALALALCITAFIGVFLIVLRATPGFCR